MQENTWARLRESSMRQGASHIFSCISVESNKGSTKNRQDQSSAVKIVPDEEQCCVMTSRRSNFNCGLEIPSPLRPEFVAL